MYLLRVELPDLPGSLGRLATAIGDAGGNINAIEIVGSSDGRAIDDVFLSARSGVMPDNIVSAVQEVEGMEVLWINRYAGGSNIFLDLEAVEAMTANPSRAIDTLVDLLPRVFRVDWGLRVRRDAGRIIAMHGTETAPTEVPADVTWPEDGETRQFVVGEDLLVGGTLLGEHQALVFARRGGPEFVQSELARLDHLAALARSISR
jgi:hypothetical protein